MISYIIEAGKCEELPSEVLTAIGNKEKELGVTITSLTTAKTVDKCKTGLASAHTDVSEMSIEVSW